MFPEQDGRQEGGGAGQARQDDAAGQRDASAQQSGGEPAAVDKPQGGESGKGDDRKAAESGGARAVGSTDQPADETRQRLDKLEDEVRSFVTEGRSFFERFRAENADALAALTRRVDEVGQRAEQAAEDVGRITRPIHDAVKEAADSMLANSGHALHQKIADIESRLNTMARNAKAHQG